MTRDRSIHHCFVVILCLLCGASAQMIQAPGDVDGDARADIVTFRPATGTRYVLRSSSNNTSYASYQWGVPGDIPTPGDYDGDGKSDIAVYRPATATWYILRSSTNNATFVAVQWGVGGDVPMPGDYDGDGKTDVAVYRPATGFWYIQRSSNGAFLPLQWGITGDVPVSADYDGDGKTDVAVYRPATGTWYVLRSSSNNTTFSSYQWGITADAPVVGDYDGDGRADPAVYRAGTGYWYVLPSTTNYAGLASYQWGIGGDVPVPGDFDGDGKTDVTVFRPGTAVWYVLRSSTGFTTFGQYQWGIGGDLPVRSAPLPKANSAPVIAAVTVSPSGDGILGATSFTFTAQGVSDPDGDALTYAWTSSDGAIISATGPVATRVYPTAGGFTMRVTVTDSKGHSASAMKSVTVGNLSGTWDVTCDNKPPYVPILYPNFPSQFVVTLTQTGVNLTGTISGGSFSRTFPSPGAAAANRVSDPKQAGFGVETAFNAWAPNDGDFYFHLTADDTLAVMSGNSQYCGVAVARRRGVPAK